MIFLVTGEKNEGKTRYMQSLFLEIGGGDGFICPKMYKNGEMIRYDLHRLSDGKTVPFAYPFKTVPANWEEACRFGKYSFSAKGIQFAEKIINRVIINRIEPFYIDEIGLLEIENQGGFYNLVK
jgi:nucleoside-triphosphatase THEP1